MSDIDKAVWLLKTIGLDITYTDDGLEVIAKQIMRMGRAEAVTYLRDETQHPSIEAGAWAYGFAEVIESDSFNGAAQASSTDAASSYPLPPSLPTSVAPAGEDHGAPIRQYGARGPLSDPPSLGEYVVVTYADHLAAVAAATENAVRDYAEAHYANGVKRYGDGVKAARRSVAAMRPETDPDIAHVIVSDILDAIDALEKP